MDIIFALATSNSRSALHLHRLSGNGVLKILGPYLFSAGGKKNLDLPSHSEKPLTRYAIIKNKNNEIIDDVVFTYFANPRSFTGEDVVEISTHGNPTLSLQLHSFLRNIGFRDAKPGEFTQRAMLHGKLDLAQAEGINQLIHAESLGGIELARNNVDGILSQETKGIRNQIIELLAYLEAHIDFAPDEVGNYEPKQLLPKITEIKNKLNSLYQSYENGLKIREGLKIILCGKPNSGKSSLYNGFLKQDRAIVTNIPGTTRDVLEDKLYLDNKEFVLLDTAGIRNTTDEVEKIGVERTLSNVKQADIICYLISSPNLSANNYNQEIENEIREFKEQAQVQSSQKIIVVVTKKDLLPTELQKAFSTKNILISQNDYANLKENLLNLHHELLDKTDLKKSPMIISQRQKDKVSAALQFIEESEQLISIADYPEKIASLLNGARTSLEEIVGEISVDNVFEKIFSTFCIGK